MKKLKIIIILIAIIMNGCGENSTKKKVLSEHQKVLSEYQKGYNYGYDLDKTDDRIKKIAHEIEVTNKMEDGTIKLMQFANISGKVSVACPLVVYKNDIYKNRVEFASGVKQGCFDRLSFLSKKN